MYDVGELIRSEAYLDALAESLDGGGPPPLLRCAKIKLTSRCNLRCVMCKYWQTVDERTLSSGRWREVFAELGDLGCGKIHFSGGEIFLRRDVLDLVAAAIDRGLKVNLTTNGTLLDRERADRLAALGVNSVSISLDGPSARTHDRIRGQAQAFKRSVRAIRRLRAADPRLKIRINTVLMRTNFRRLPAVVRLGGELGVTDVLPMPVDEKGARKHRLSARQILEYNREVAPRVAETRQAYGFSTATPFVYPFGVTDEEVRLSARGLYARGFFERRACLAPWLHAFFAWDGETYLCCMTNGRMASLGNVGTASVREVFHGEAYRRVREEFAAGRHLGSCHRCDLFLAENAALHAALDQARERGRAGRPGVAGVDPAPARQ
jgi:MoaA/NifB/PqqE/SkfB family radical SAM enzyme